MLGEKMFIHKFELAKKRLEEYELEVIAMQNALTGVDYLYQHPDAIPQDLMDAFRNPEIKAVFNAIGRDDSIRICHISILMFCGIIRRYLLVFFRYNNKSFYNV